MSSRNVTLSRLDRLYLAKVADQAERYRDVITQLKDIINSCGAQLTMDERNLLSIAYKNLTANLRSSWRTIDTLQKKEALSSTRQQVRLMRAQKELIEKDINDLCKEVLNLLESTLMPAADDGEEKVFYSKMRGDYYRYLAELTRLGNKEELAAASLDAYKFAYKLALETLLPTHPTRLGLALNFAVYFHDILRSPERACHLAKHAFDEAVAAATDSPSTIASLEDSLMILQLIRDDIILWQGELNRAD
ncbi:14-3-3-like protein [Trametes punicea]|nr:14-3-3-like protein [Trametes punicea]